MCDLVRLVVVCVLALGACHLQMGCEEQILTSELQQEAGPAKETALVKEPTLQDAASQDAPGPEVLSQDSFEADTTTPDLIPEKGHKKVVLGLSFPPVSDEASRQFTQQHTASNALRVRLIRFAEDWALREPTKGKVNLTPLLKRFTWAKEQGLSIFLTLQSNGPDWACVPGTKNKRSCRFQSLDDWRRFLDVLFAAFKQNNAPLHAIQFGNEWQSTFWYAGSAEEFVSAHNIMVEKLKEHKLNIPVVLGGFSIGALRALAGCDKKIKGFYDDEGRYLEWGAKNPAYDLETLCADTLVTSTKKRIEHVLANAKYTQLDLHLYDDVENWGIYVGYFREKLPGVPLVVTEFGGPNLVWEKPYSDELQARRLTAYLEKLQTLDLVAAYFFKLVQNDSSHFTHLESGLFRLVNNVPQKKSAYDAFKRYTHPASP